MVANMQVFDIAVESNNLDDLVISRDNCHNVNGVLLFNTGNLSCNLNFTADAAVRKYFFPGFRCG